MSYSKEEFIAAGIKVEDELIANAGVEWLRDHTTLEIEELEDIPSGAKVFIKKFVDINSTNNMIKSESIAGMSQTYREEAIEELIWSIANMLIGKYLKSNVNVLVNREKWY